MTTMVLLLVIQLMLLLIVAFLLYERNMQGRQNKIQLEHIYEQIEKKSIQITDSINYAKRIQESILLPQEDMQKIFPESFVFFKAKDVVSGDFYWISVHGDKVIIAVADCVGHGVPGAFMSMIGNTLLNQIVNEKEVMLPNEILRQMNSAIVKSLHQANSNSQNQTQDDGMDVSLCIFDRKTRELQFSGANHSVFLINNNKLEVVRGELFAIGGFAKNVQKEFITHTMTLEPDTYIYMFSDGFHDQFGGPGPSRKKFMSVRFKELILGMHRLPMAKQRQKIESELISWQGKQSQTDDIVVMGIKV